MILEFTYSSMIPPSFEALSKIVKVALKPLLGKITVTELPHKPLTVATWIMVLSVEGQNSIEGIAAAEAEAEAALRDALNLVEKTCSVSTWKIDLTVPKKHVLPVLFEAGAEEETEG